MKGEFSRGGLKNVSGKVGKGLRTCSKEAFGPDFFFFPHEVHLPEIRTISTEKTTREKDQKFLWQKEKELSETWNHSPLNKRNATQKKNNFALTLKSPQSGKKSDTKPLIEGTHACGDGQKGKDSKVQKKKRAPICFPRKKLFQFDFSSKKAKKKKKTKHHQIPQIQVKMTANPTGGGGLLPRKKADKKNKKTKSQKRKKTLTAKKFYF